MPALDSLLRIVDSQGANELRLGSDKAPSMFSQGAPKKLTMPATTTDTLKQLFGELLDETRMAQLERLGRVEFSHDAEKVGPFKVTITKRPTAALAFDAIVIRSSAPSPPAAPPPPAPREVPPPVAARPLSAPPAAPAIEQSQAPAPRHPYRLAPSLHDLLARVLSMGASDIHLADGDAPTARIHGRLVPLEYQLSEPLSEIAASMIGPAFEARVAAQVSSDLSLDLPNGYRGRMNVYATSRGLAMAIRILPRSVPALATLGFPVPLDELAHLPNGLVLVTGATGSGKSTTLAALTQEAVKHRSVVLVTLEDPIEYLFDAQGTASLVRQRQIGRDVRDFSTGLRDALREDPDVLLIGEMRDAESIQLALTAAETGHLVLASLHSRSAVSAVERIIDTYPPERQTQIRVMLADSLRAVVAQRLVPREHGAGRVLAAEVLRVTTSVASAIRDSKLGSMKSSMQAGRSDGMITLERHLVDLVRKRAISLETARGAANDPTTLAQYMQTG